MVLRVGFLTRNGFAGRFLTHSGFRGFRVSLAFPFAAPLRHDHGPARHRGLRLALRLPLVPGPGQRAGVHGPVRRAVAVPAGGQGAGAGGRAAGRLRRAAQAVNERGCLVVLVLYTLDCTAQRKKIFIWSVFMCVPHAEDAINIVFTNLEDMD